MATESPDFFRRLVEQTFDMHRRIVDTNLKLAAKLDRIIADQERMQRSITALATNVSTEMHDLNSRMDRADKRFDGIGARFDDIEASIDRVVDSVKSLETEVTGELNDLLNARQAALQGEIAVGEVMERVEELERRLPNA